MKEPATHLRYIHEPQSYIEDLRFLHMPQMVCTSAVFRIIKEQTRPKIV